MSEYNENLDREEESTIFSAPQNDEEPPKSAGRLKKVLLALLVLVLLVGAAFAVGFLIPEKDPDEGASDLTVEEFALLDQDSAAYTSVELVNSSETIEFVASSKDDATVWLIPDIDAELLDTDATASAINAFLGLRYTRELEPSADVDYGFDRPVYTVTFRSADNTLTLTVGNLSPDSSGRYVSLSDRQKVYFVRADAFSSFDKVSTDFALAGSVTPLTGDSADYYTDGTLTTFDRIVISGASLDDTYTFEPNKDEGDTAFYQYRIVSPVSRPADDESTQAIFNLFAQGVSGSGVYSYTASAEQLAAYGLDKPDFTAAIYAGNDSKTIRAKLQPDGDYAVTADGLKPVLRVAASALSPASFAPTEYYNTFFFIESLLNADTLTVSSPQESYTFSVELTYDEERQTNDIAAVTVDGRAVTAEYVQDYYAFLIGIQAVEYRTVDTGGQTPDATVTITHHDGSPATVVRYFKVSEGRYQVEVNGTPLGMISASNFRNIVKYAANAAQDKPYNS